MCGRNDASGGLSELRYKLRVRCLSCMDETYPIVSLGMQRRDAATIDRRVRKMAENIPFECHRCSGKSSQLVAYFESPPTRLAC